MKTYLIVGMAMFAALEVHATDADVQRTHDHGRKARLSRMLLHSLSENQASKGARSDGIRTFRSLELDEAQAPEPIDQDFFMDERDAMGMDISPWHDVPLYNDDGTLNFVCEIPKETTPKMEVATDEPFTPIKQDIKDGNLRFYPYNINWNYGMFPLTWEDPDVINTEVDEDGVSGDNDPLDVVEIGTSACTTGGVYRVKPICVYAMIDDGELDWKVIAVNADEPGFESINNAADMETFFPGELEKIRVWFRDYKIPDGKPANQFGLDNKCIDEEDMMEVIEVSHGFYNALKSGIRENTEELSLI